MTTSTFQAADGNDYETSPDALGDGGQGTVFLGRRCSDGTDVAVKRIIHGAARGPVKNRELQIALRLGETPPQHLLAPLTWAVEGTDLLLVMPRADRSLVQELAEYPDGMAEADLLEILRDISTGLVELRTEGIVHRDLKPANVLLYDGRWHVADFGMSRDLDVRTATETFQYGGTLPYWAPERWRGLPATYKTDLYALGCIGHELATGSWPFPGLDVNQLQHQHLHMEPPAVPVGPALARWIMRLLDKDPAGRHQDAQAALVALPAGPGSQGPLAAAALQRAQRRQQQAAAQGLAVTAADVVAAERRQALADLAEICASAADRARQDLPDLGWDSHGGIKRFFVDEVRLEFHLWQPIEGHEGLVLVGEVSTVVNDLHRCAANFVCESDGGRQTWYLDTVTRNAMYGIVEAPAGFSDEPEFFTHYRAFRQGGTYEWDRHRRPLTPDAIVDTLAELLVEASRP